jgi:hypothetical protein
LGFALGFAATLRVFLLGFVFENEENGLTVFVEGGQWVSLELGYPGLFRLHPTDSHIRYGGDHCRQLIQE